MSDRRDEYLLNVVDLLPEWVPGKPRRWIAQDPITGAEKEITLRGLHPVETDEHGHQTVRTDILT